MRKARRNKHRVAIAIIELLAMSLPESKRGTPKIDHDIKNGSHSAINQLLMSGWGQLKMHSAQDSLARAGEKLLSDVKANPHVTECLTVKCLHEFTPAIPMNIGHNPKQILEFCRMKFHNSFPLIFFT